MYIYIINFTLLYSRKACNIIKNKKKKKKEKKIKKSARVVIKGWDWKKSKKSMINTVVERNKSKKPQIMSVHILSKFRLCNKLIA